MHRRSLLAALPAAVGTVAGCADYGGNTNDETQTDTPTPDSPADPFEECPLEAEHGYEPHCEATEDPDIQLRTESEFDEISLEGIVCHERSEDSPATIELALVNRTDCDIAVETGIGKEDGLPFSNLEIEHDATNARMLLVPVSVENGGDDYDEYEELRPESRDDDCWRANDALFQRLGQDIVEFQPGGQYTARYVLLSPHDDSRCKPEGTYGGDQEILYRRGDDDPPEELVEIAQSLRIEYR